MNSASPTYVSIQVAGTEEGIKEPQATFSACFGAAFIMLHPTKYAAMLAAKMQKHGATGWLVNTGWSGGRYRASQTKYFVSVDKGLKWIILLSADMVMVVVSN